MTRQKKYFFYPGFLLLLLSACTARITGNLETGGAGDFEVSAALTPRMSTLIRSLSAALGDGGASEHTIDGESIARSMGAAPGIASVSFRNTGPGAIEGPVKISRLGDFLAAAGPSGTEGGFINFEQAPPGSSGSSRCTLTLDRASGPQILALISPDVADYLSALMAPIATGEEISKDEYLELAASLYGQALADEIRGAFIRASVVFPGPVTAVQGGTWSGRRVEFNISLTDLLVLETPLVYEVSWR
jgi:hypothetical protein